MEQTTRVQFGHEHNYHCKSLIFNEKIRSFIRAKPVLDWPSELENSDAKRIDL